MEPSVWITICIFALFDFLLANPIQSLEGLTKEFDHEELIENIKCQDTSTFYTPTNVEPECIAAAINCSFLELSQVVRFECEDPNKMIMSNVEALELIKNRVKAVNVKNSANDCACEKWPQTRFNEFLANIKTLFELQLSQQSLNDKVA